MLRAFRDNDQNFVRLHFSEGRLKKLTLLLLLIASTAQGEIYTWTDSRGTAHYTNSMYDVPARYRTRVKILAIGPESKTGQPQSTTSGAPPAVTPLESAPLQKPAATLDAQPSTLRRPAAVSSGTQLQQGGEARRGKGRRRGAATAEPEE